MPTLKVDGRKLEVREGLTLLDVCREHGISIPTLCYHEAVTPYGACRLCLVEVTAGPKRMLVASCTYPAADGISVKTASPRVLKARRVVAELLLARCPDVPRIKEIALEAGVTRVRFPGQDHRCVLCGLCVRGCHEIAGADVLEFANRGVLTEIVTPFELPSENCVGCTTCIYLCPTDALKLNEIRRVRLPHGLEDDEGRRLEPRFHDVEGPTK